MVARIVMLGWPLLFLIPFWVVAARRAWHLEQPAGVQTLFEGKK